MQATNNKRADRWLARFADSKAILPLIFIASLLESLIIPIPLELILIPLLLHQQDRLWAIATATLLGCLVGASIGYSIGFWFLDDFGDWVLTALGYQNAFEAFTVRFEEHGFATLLLVGITPVPFQVGMLAAGSAEYPFLLFMLAATIARGIRYYGLALLVYWFGERVLDWWQQQSRRAGWWLLAIGIVVYGSYLLI
ncbi:MULTISPECIES: YqaA family protein [Pseudidiomarina]|uniref:Alkaline phosphatase n=2 Tax=Pseudidiomarina TaxID=2800384 RepID=A0A432YJK0_9GAMM|nr:MULTISPECIES: VTT domain-containing protein [Pseudidiomarina]MDS0218387.1 VTT domain-containing protein [Pseudidiomarina andamanensis]PHR66868.1 MAG: alkaline phosphatase [Idiomarina sp.]QGT95271.1 DedA family protein [Pseudidiomarina andamanensis]RUO61132.1 alkaline phosphatase [Pseudidiomarina marina]